MVKVKIDVKKKDLVWIIPMALLFCLGIVYAYGSSSPSIMGHDLGELNLAGTASGNIDFIDSVSVLGTVRLRGNNFPGLSSNLKITSCNWNGWLSLDRPDECTPSDIVDTCGSTNYYCNSVSGGRAFSYYCSVGWQMTNIKYSASGSSYYKCVGKSSSSSSSGGGGDGPSDNSPSNTREDGGQKSSEGGDY